ncbi:YceK/YidQ family lipoprotein [Cronobacter sakazakii]|uniref:YceK/YidQ family lipoprotein n=1 Tax=Cronobacter sakazakii TaxID=28141 RepID=UPI002894DCAD|nr:YceK/YidQ family lipoprotein [Cronobacter sakazakii]EIZ9238598.1 YceK/YidQ family lipoprotein [Cronobacter sakazakii]ELY4183582.1 YceK/YidQ family lipoprotein [Cronobacter sakazakii]MDT3652853.1 YceK/YidQ family lipoprotein [Cronobacter sakazakii]
MKMNNTLGKVIFCSSALLLGGCSSVMSHTGGGEQGYYPGTRASATMLADDDTSWGLKPLVALDLPFTVIADTLLIPWDAFRTDKSVKSRVEESEKKSFAINAVIPPAP